MSKTFTVKCSLGGRNLYCKKQFRWAKYIMQKVPQVNKIYTVKSSLGE